jgi:hypothetical protein
MDAPEFPQPMYDALCRLSQDHLLPGLDGVPHDRVLLLQTNARFIESFMVGLSAEMSRELLWRGYPTDQRGTYFRHFWDTSVGEGARPDITAIHTWGTRPLGVDAMAATGDMLVVLIRGEVLRRYPGTVVYAARAVRRDGRLELAPHDPDPGSPPVEAYPVFRGTLEPDVVFVGFDLAPQDATADPGWFFVVQQQPTEPRFGLDDAPFGEADPEIPELKTWNDLNWAHLAPSPQQLADLHHVSAGAVQLAPTQTVPGTWGRNAAHMALITRQLPVRVAIHASQFLPKDGS